MGSSAGHIKDGTYMLSGRSLATSGRAIGARLGEVFHLAPGRRNYVSAKADSRPRVVLFARVDDVRLLDLLEFYAEDVAVLESLGFDVLKSNRAWQAAKSQGDVLLAWWWHTSWPTSFWWRLRGRPVLMTGAHHLNDRLRTHAPLDLLALALTAAAAQFASVNIAISREELDGLRRLAAPRTRLIHCSVDTSYFLPGVKAPAPLAVIVGQMNPGSIKRKGVDVAIRAAALLGERIPDFRLVVAGPLTEEGAAALESIVAECGARNVEIRGQLSREEKREVLSAAWWYLQPSQHEGFGLAVVEAMASGAVPVCSTAGSLPEVVGEGGILLSEATPKNIAAVIDAMSRDRGRLGESAQKARVQALSYSRHARSERMVQALVDAGVAVPAISEADGMGRSPGSRIDD